MAKFSMILAAAMMVAVITATMDLNGEATATHSPATTITVTTTATVTAAHNTAHGAAIVDFSYFHEFLVAVWLFLEALWLFMKRAITFHLWLIVKLSYIISVTFGFWKLMEWLDFAYKCISLFWIFRGSFQKTRSTSTNK